MARLGVKQSDIVSILGLARSPTSSTLHFGQCVVFQYLGSRGAQQIVTSNHPVITTFQYLGSRGAQLVCFVKIFPCISVSILGLARSPTCRDRICRKGNERFNTWAREEPNPSFLIYSYYFWKFQYLGSRGAQRCSLPLVYTFLQVSILGLARSPTYSFYFYGFLLYCFNTWAREEPNVPVAKYAVHVPVSILGLARSPTNSLPLSRFRIAFQYLGSRGAQPRRVEKSAPPVRFNTWAREEPNLENETKLTDSQAVSILGLARSPTEVDYLMRRSARVSILGLARSPTYISFCQRRDFLFQYLGSRGAQPTPGPF